MKKHLFVFGFIILSLLSFDSKGQTYGNEWIHYDQSYYKIKITRTGIYKITKSALATAGFPVSTINPQNIKLYFRGHEQPIYIKGEEDYIFDDGDYILFYGQGNDGWLDSALFETPKEQANPHYSLITDTAVYFLTWQNDTTPKKRFEKNTDTDFSSYSATTTAQAKILKNYTGAYYEGSSIPWYNEGEGWFDNAIITNSSNQEKSIELPQWKSGTSAIVSFCVAGIPANYVYSSKEHDLVCKINNNTYLDTTFSGYQQATSVKTVATSDMSNPLKLSFTSSYTGADNDRMALAYISVTYQRNLDATGESQIEGYNITSSEAKIKLQFSNFSGDATSPVIDFSTQSICFGQKSGDTYEVLLPNTSLKKHHFWLQSSATIETVSHIEKFIPIDYSANKSADYIIITHPSLMSSATQYAAYRQTKGYTPLVVDITQLYDQFAYGIEQHPLAIRHFVNWMASSFDSIPKALFLFGKSVHPQTVRQMPSLRNQYLVPTWGTPSSDILLAVNPLSSHYEPILPVGRLSVLTNQEANAYLQKIKDYESNAPAEWMKHILHFGGGSDAQQQNEIASYLNFYKSLLEDPYFGGTVETFLKTTSLPIQITKTDSIKQLINNGVSLITFFGHGSSSGFDQNIDYPSAYDNTGRYPLISAASCFSGDVHLPRPWRLPEEWVLQPQKGAIAFFASGDAGYSVYMNKILTELFRQVSQKNYGKSLGYQIKQIIHGYAASGSNNLYLIKTLLDYTLLGDPAIVINSFPKPDLTVSKSQLLFSPTYISNVADSFNLDIVITNIGKAVTDSFVIQIERTFPDETIEYRQITVGKCYFKDTLHLKLATVGIHQAGNNRLSVRVDAMSQIDELNETNNEASIDFTVHSIDVYPVYPYHFSIYPHDTLTLVASTGSPFQSSQRIVFQIDTTDTYDSPALLQTVIVSDSGIVKWRLPFHLTDSTVYFWRTYIEGNTQKNESSFIYEEGKTGWSQAHFFQYKNNSFRYLDYNRLQRQFQYIITPHKLHIHNIGTVSSSHFLNVSYDIDAEGDNSCCGAGDALIVAVFDSLNLTPWTSDRADFGHRDYPKCYSRSRADKYFVFSTDSTSQERLTAFLSAVPENNYIIVYSWRNAHFSQWEDTLFSTFENLGDSAIRLMHDSIPYAFFTQKGHPEKTVVVKGTSPTDTIDLYEDIPNRYNFGEMTSPRIGPALRWKSFNWKPFSDDTITSDSSFVTIYGIDTAEKQILLKTISQDSLQWINLASTIDANIYPYLKLKLSTFDDSLHTPTQLHRWQLTYDEAPETAINPSKGYFLSADTLQEGETLYFGVATENVSPYDMDSLLVRYTLIDAQNDWHIVKTKRLPPHKAHTITMDTLAFRSLHFPGHNRLQIEYNPINTTTGRYDQPEAFHFNNMAEVSFEVLPDKKNPVLDVTFDNRHIFDGEIVSATPVIKIHLIDENKYLPLNDTDDFRIYLTTPDDTAEQRLYFCDADGNPILDFLPASLPNNHCVITYKPIFSQDGIYRLRVEAVDASNNESGKYDYEISFKIVTHLSITNLYAYPNPFSSQTRFVFTLTGSTVPDVLHLEIYSATGQLVRIIDLNETESLHIGYNVTKVTWNGCDANGTPLANGLYIYRVIAAMNGTPIDKRACDQDKYLEKSFGKIYLMR
jgi:hypothetical protein